MSDVEEIRRSNPGSTVESVVNSLLDEKITLSSFMYVLMDGNMDLGVCVEGLIT